MDTESSPVAILCVDDEPGLADLIATHLEQHDEQLRTTTATSARDGLNQLETVDVDCIVSDYNMPDIDGLEFLEIVRADQPDMPFILFTGRGSEEIASDAISAGVTDYMQKGVGTDQYQVLAQRIRNAVERHRARTQRMEAEQRARTILNASPDAVLVSMNSEYVYANPAAVDLFNADSETDLVGHSILDLIHPDDRDEVQNKIEPVATGGQTVTRVGRTVQTLDGQEVSVEVTGRQITWDGENGIVAILRDLSTPEQRTRTQQRYRAAFENGFDAMVIFDDDQQITDVNQSGCELSGRSQKDLIGSGIGKVFTDEFDLEEAWQEFKAADQIRGTASIQRPNGEKRIIEYTTSADIVPGEHLTVARDVTEQEEYIDKIESKNEQLEKFASFVSHDLRSPLNVAQGRVVLAQQDCESEHLADAVAALKRSHSLIDDLLRLAREGEQVSEVESVDLAEAINTCWENVKTGDATYDAETDRTIQADRSRLQQLLENLIRNALEHGGDGVTVTVGEMENGFYVSDNGPGIPQGEREQVFEAGYSTTGDGTGFGLQIVKEIANGHGWEISVTEGDEGGARFEIIGVDFADE